ncbi:MAG: GNAT family N-acetyltransferase [Pseudomonadota bacterium]
MITLRQANEADNAALWDMLEPVIRAGETYALETDLDRADALAFWCGEGHEVWIAEIGPERLGTYYLCANKRGPGDHVANCGYISHPDAQGRGVARAMLDHSLDRARESGFLAMQFNAVVATNARALDIWYRAGFEQTGVNRAAFRHPSAGLVDMFILYRPL